MHTFVSKALWYRIFTKLDCSLIWNLHKMCQSMHSSNCNFMKKMKSLFFARGKNVLYNAIMLKYWGYSILYETNLNRLTSKMSFLLKTKSKEIDHFYLVKFSHGIWGANGYILPNFYVGAVKNLLNVCNLQRCPIQAVVL